MLEFFYNKRYILLITILITLLFSYKGLIKAVNVDNSLEVWFLEDDPSVLDYYAFQKKFGNDEIIMLVIKDNENMLNEKQSKKIVSLSNALNNLPDVKSVFSPADQEILQLGILGIEKRKLYQNYDENYIRKYFNQFKNLKNQFFSADEKSIRFIIVLENIKNFDAERGRIINEIKSTADSIINPENTYWGGIGIIYAGLNDLSAKDFGLFLGIGYICMFLVILYLYRSIWVVIHALLTVILSTVFCLAIYGYNGHQLNIMTSLLPTILVLLGIMDTLHIYNERNNFIKQGYDSREASFLALRAEIKPCLFTSLTTIAGFLALLSSPMAILKNFGLYAALGIAFCFIFTYILALFFLPKSKAHSPSEEKINRFLLNFEKTIVDKKSTVIILYLIIFGISIYGIQKIKIDTETMSYFPKNYEVIKDHETIENTFGAYMPLEISIEAKDSNILSKEIITKCFEYENEILQKKVAEKANGFYTFLEETNKYIPIKSDTNAENKYELAAFYFKQLNPVLYNYYINDSLKAARISLFGRIPSSIQLTQKTDSAMNIAKSIFGDQYIVKSGGYQLMYSKIAKYTVDSQVNSIIIAFIAILILIWIFIKDFKLALISMASNMFPILILFAFMGFAGIKLDLATASIAAICLSFCIDDTIHFIFHYKKYRNSKFDVSESINRTTQKVGAAIVMTSLVLFFGYILLIFGSLKTVIYFGLLTSIAILSALVAQLSLNIALIKYFDKD